MNKALILILFLTILKLYSQKKSKDDDDCESSIYISKEMCEEGKRINKNDEPVYTTKESREEARKSLESGECIYCN